MRSTKFTAEFGWRLRDEVHWTAQFIKWFAQKPLKMALETATD